MNLKKMTKEDLLKFFEEEIVTFIKETGDIPHKEDKIFKSYRQFVHIRSGVLLPEIKHMNFNDEDINYLFEQIDRAMSNVYKLISDMDELEIACTKNDRLPKPKEKMYDVYLHYVAVFGVNKKYFRRLSEKDFDNLKQRFTKLMRRYSKYGEDRLLLEIGLIESYCQQEENLPPCNDALYVAYQKIKNIDNINLTGTKGAYLSNDIKKNLKQRASVIESKYEKQIQITNYSEMIHAIDVLRIFCKNHNRLPKRSNKDDCEMVNLYNRLSHYAKGQGAYCKTELYQSLSENQKEEIRLQMKEIEDLYGKPDIVQNFLNNFEELKVFCKEIGDIPTVHNCKNNTILRATYVTANSFLHVKGNKNTKTKDEVLKSSLYKNMTEEQFDYVCVETTKLQATYRKTTPKYSSADLEPIVCEYEKLCKRGIVPTLKHPVGSNEYKLAYMVNNHLKDLSTEQCNRIRKAKSLEKKAKIVSISSSSDTSTISTTPQNYVGKINTNDIIKAKNVLIFCEENGRKPKIKESLYNQLTGLNRKRKKYPLTDESTDIEKQFFEIMNKVDTFKSSQSTSYFESIIYHSLKHLFGSESVKKVKIKLPTYSSKQYREWDVFVELFNLYINIDGYPHMFTTDKDKEAIRDLFVYDPKAIAVRIRYDGIPSIETENERTLIINLNVASIDVQNGSDIFLLVRKTCQQIIDFCCKVNSDSPRKLSITREQYEYHVLPEAKNAKGVKSQIKEKFYENITKYPYLISKTYYSTGTEEERQRMREKKNTAVWFDKYASRLNSKEKEYLDNRPTKEEYEIHKQRIEDLIDLGMKKEQFVQYAILNGLEKQYWIQQYIA